MGIFNVEALKNVVSSLNESPETKAQLQDLRKEVATGYVEKLKKEKSDLMLTVAEDQVLDYLIDDGITDQFHDAVVGKLLESMSGLSPDLKEFREKLNKASTKEELEALKSQITPPENAQQNETSEGDSPEQSDTSSDQSGTLQTPEENKDWNQTSDERSSSNDWGSVNPWTAAFSRAESFAGFEEQRPFIQGVLASAQKEIGKPYVRWGSKPWGRGFDCSGLRNCAFSGQGVRFPTRFTASLFDKTDVNLAQDQVRVWDFMFWEEQPGKKKHNAIYHIEMVLEKPFKDPKDWKRKVKTIGSSTDRGVLDENGNKTNKNGVGYRIREITDYRHFGRPPYYAQLAKQEKKWETWKILASTQKPNQQQASEVLA